MVWGPSKPPLETSSLNLPWASSKPVGSTFFGGPLEASRLNLLRSDPADMAVDFLPGRRPLTFTTMRRMLGVGDGEGGLAVGQLGVATLIGFAPWYMKAGGRSQGGAPGILVVMQPSPAQPSPARKMKIQQQKARPTQKRFTQNPGPKPCTISQPAKFAKSKVKTALWAILSGPGTASPTLHGY